MTMAVGSTSGVVAPGTSSAAGTPHTPSQSRRAGVLASVAGAGRSLLRWVPAAVVILGLVLVWEWAARTGRLPITVPAPTTIRAEFDRSRTTLWFHTEPTIRAAAKGYLVATAVAGLLGVLVAIRPGFGGPVYKTSVIVSSIPLVALTPVLVLWLDRGDAVRTTVAVLAGFFPILVGCIQGFGIRDSGRDELFVVLSARGWQRFLRLTFPSSLPYVFAGLKAAAASCVLGAIIAEWSGGGGTRGLGQMMTNALFGFNVAQTWLTILTAAGLAMGAYAIVAITERVVVRWDHGTTGVGL